MLEKSNKVIYNSKRIKEKNYWIISIDMAKAFDKIHHSLMINSYKAKDTRESP